MDQLPVEVLHYVCANIDSPTDVGSFRMVCNIFAAIGIHYLIRNVHVVLLPKSLERLKYISEHPVLSTCVESITYSGNLLPHISTFREYREHARNPDVRADWAENAPLDQSDLRAQRAWHRDIRKAETTPHQMPRTKAVEEWKRYEDAVIFQEKLWTKDTDRTMIKAAMKRLTKLKSLRMFTNDVQTRVVPRDSCFEDEQYGCNTDKAMDKAYKDTLIHPAPFCSSDRPSGARQLEILLQCAQLSNTKFTELYAGFLSSIFFEVSKPRFNIVVSSLAVCTSFGNYGSTSPLI